MQLVGMFWVQVSGIIRFHREVQSVVRVQRSVASRFHCSLKGVDDVLQRSFLQGSCCVTRVFEETLQRMDVLSETSRFHGSTGSLRTSEISTQNLCVASVTRKSCCRKISFLLLFA